MFQDDSEIKLYIGLDLLHKAESFMKKPVQPPFETTSWAVMVSAYDSVRWHGNSGGRMPHQTSRTKSGSTKTLSILDCITKIKEI